MVTLRNVRTGEEVTIEVTGFKLSAWESHGTHYSRYEWEIV